LQSKRQDDRKPFEKTQTGFKFDKQHRILHLKQRFISECYIKFDGGPTYSCQDQK